MTGVYQRKGRRCPFCARTPGRCPQPARMLAAARSAAKLPVRYRRTGNRNTAPTSGA